MRRLIALATALLLLAFAATPALGLTPQRIWHAALGTGGVNGRVTLTAWTNDTGSIQFAVTGLRANTSYRPEVRAGTCASLGKVLTLAASFRTNAGGAATDGRGVSQYQINRVWSVGRTGSMAFRVVATNGSAKCGNLGFPHATRVYFPSYHIDLPVVPGPSGYPYCNVAMYQKVLWQPNEPGVTFIYAHARTGMFLPLLTASKVNNGSALIGRLVYVMTSDSMMYTYRITQVRRHVSSVQSAIGITSEHLWLQTSEGPNFTYPKLVIVADRIASAPVSYRSAHPTPHIVHCG